MPPISDVSCSCIGLNERIVLVDGLYDAIDHSIQTVREWKKIMDRHEKSAPEMMHGIAWYIEFEEQRQKDYRALIEIFDKLPDCGG